MISQDVVYTNSMKAISTFGRPISSRTRSITKARVRIPRTVVEARPERRRAEVILGRRFRAGSPFHDPESRVCVRRIHIGDIIAHETSLFSTVLSAANANIIFQGAYRLFETPWNESHVRLPEYFHLKSPALYNNWQQCIVPDNSPTIVSLNSPVCYINVGVSVMPDIYCVPELVRIYETESIRMGRRTSGSNGHEINRRTLNGHRDLDV
jgi:hypothetical protein